MMFAPAALLPMPVAKAVLWPVGVAALITLFLILQRLARPAFALTNSQTFWATVLAAFLAIQFVIRDQAELGLNTIVVALVWLAIYLWQHRHDLSAGVTLGAAIAVKCVPALFLAYFLWKRQGRVALYAAAATVLFSVSPVLFEGLARWTDQARQWSRTVIDAVPGNGFEQAENFRDRNLALRAVLMRYLTQPPPANIEPSAALPPVNFLNLSTSRAKLIANAILILSLALFLWWTRAPVKSRDEPRLLWELAGTGILMVLLSPITWTQTCVVVLPACFFVSALIVRGERLPAWITGAICFYVIFCVLLGRDLVGRRFWTVIASHHFMTLSLVALLVVVLAGPQLRRSR
jgi:alpha-1,2-mannosyltransferase